MSRPSDAKDRFDDDGLGPVANPSLGPVEWLRWAWRQLTSMRTALLLLLALAVAAVPGSVIPQNSADPNGVAEWRATNPVGYRVLDAVQGFDVYSSVWFSAIYLLLFLSLVGCVVPRVRHHLSAVRARPPRTPSRFDRLPARGSVRIAGSVAGTVDAADAVLRRKGYRTERYGTSVSAERGYLRETGNLVFHSALLGVLVAVFVGGGFTWTAQRVVATGETFTNTQIDYDTLNPGRFFDAASLSPYSLKLDRLDVRYQNDPRRPGFGSPLDYTAHVTASDLSGKAERRTIKVNSPLDIGGTSVFLLGNGYAPRITVRDAEGRKLLDDAAVPFQPQGASMVSLGVIKARGQGGADLGMQGFLYPTAVQRDGQPDSLYPGLGSPLVSLNVWKGRLGNADDNAFVLDTSGGRLTKVAGQDTDAPPIQLTREKPTATLPDGLGTVTLDGIDRYAALDVHHDPSQGWVACFVALAVLGLITSLLVPRRRLWIKVTEGPDGNLLVEYAGLARGDDPGLARAVGDLEREHRAALPADADAPLVRV